MHILRPVQENHLLTILRRLAIALNVTTDYLLGRVTNPEVSESGDPLFRNISKLTGKDRELAKEFIKILAKKNK